MAAARTLVALNVSPWSERAKWALDHHGLAYDVVPHMPVLGERRLRRLVGPDKPRATVPVLLAGAEVISESWDIAVYADREGEGSELIPTEHEAAIRDWCALADSASNAARGLVVAATLASGPALDEQALFAPAWLRPALRPVGRLATRAFARKYALRLDDGDAQTSAVRAALERLRGGLAASRYLQGAFSYADIAMAGLLQAIVPLDDRYLKIGPGTRAVWTHRALATEFPDLVSWRDRLYEGSRAARAGVA
jgi:glutathione S-transferase